MGDEAVRYGLEVIGDKIPGRSGNAGKKDPNRHSPLMDKVGEVMADENLWRTWVSIADYASGAVAGGAMRDMKHRYGEESFINGLTFTTHRYSIQDAESGEVVRDSDGRLVKRCKLLVRYDPDKINAEKRMQWQRDQIMLRGREAARKLGIDVDAITPSREYQ